MLQLSVCSKILCWTQGIWLLSTMNVNSSFPENTENKVGQNGQKNHFYTWEIEHRHAVI